jgi:hypothetical protein
MELSLSVAEVGRDQGYRPAGTRFSTRWPMARRLPGGTSTCSASMTSRTRSCETAPEFDPQN